MVTTDADGRVTRFEEKPERTDARLASMGVYLFESDVLREALRSATGRSRARRAAPDGRSPGERVYDLHEFEGYWEDVGDGRRATTARTSTCSAPEPRLQLHDARWPILTRDEERPPVLLLPGADVEDSLVANGCRIAGTVRHSILFPGVAVEAGAVVEDSVVMPDVTIGRGRARAARDPRQVRARRRAGCDRRRRADRAIPRSPGSTG